MPATPTDRLYGLTTSVAVKPPVFISADSNIILFGEQTITSVTPAATKTVTTTKGMRVLIRGQINPVENGIWEAMPAAWVRAPDFNGARDVVDGTLVFSVDGDCWQVEGTDQIRIGYDPITFRTTYPFEANLNIFQRSLRVPESVVPELPPVAERSNKLLAFNGMGQPITVLPESGSASDVMIELAKPTGAGLIGYENTTVERVLNSEVFIDYFAPVLDYGPILNAAQQTGALGGTIKMRGDRYPLATTATRRAGWTIEGVGPYATELFWTGGSDPMIKNEQVVLQSRSGQTIGNNSGQYHTSLQDIALIGNGLGVGLLRGEGWFDRMVRVIIEGFDVGQQDGLGTSNVTGCYWCRNDQVWYRNNRVNLRVTDYSNLNTWANCRFSGATNWDVEFIEPSTPLTLGMQGNRFEDCEFASSDSVYLGARIFDLNFHNPYFEQPGYSVYDGTSHSKGSVTFTGTPKFFGSQSVKNKIVVGYNGGNCQNWSFQNLKTNLGKGVGAPSTMQVIDMGPNANYFSTYHPVLTGVAGWELTQPGNLSKLKMQLYDVDGKSVLQMKSLSTERSIANAHHTVVDYTLTSNIGVDLFEKGVDVGELTTTWFTVAEVPDFAVAFAHAAFHYELTIGGRNPTSNNVKAAFLCGEVHGANGTIGGFFEVFNRQSGSAQITVEHQVIQSGTSLLVQIRKSLASTATFDQVYCAVESKAAGKFTELAI